MIDIAIRLTFRNNKA